VAYVKRMNVFVTDLQMFALKTLQIPLPGGHPPSASLSNSQPSPRKLTQSILLFVSLAFLQLASECMWRKFQYFRPIGNSGTTLLNWI
ncbi:hypothetical protein MKX01_017952, partial [Papaver californicum]